MVEFEEQAISWRPIIFISVLLLALLGVGAYFLFFQGGLVGVGERSVASEVVRYQETVATLKSLKPTAIIESDFYKTIAVVYKIEIPAVELGNKNPFGQ